MVLNTQRKLKSQNTGMGLVYYISNRFEKKIMTHTHARIPGNYRSNSTIEVVVEVKTIVYSIILTSR